VVFEPTTLGGWEIVSYEGGLRTVVCSRPPFNPGAEESEAVGRLLTEFLNHSTPILTLVETVEQDLSSYREDGPHLRYAIFNVLATLVESPKMV